MFGILILVVGALELGAAIVMVNALSLALMASIGLLAVLAARHAVAPPGAALTDRSAR